MKKRSGTLNGFGGIMGLATLIDFRTKKISIVQFILGLILLMVLFSRKLEAKEVQIIEMRKNLSLKNNEKIQTDYFLNAGTELSIKPGTLFTLYRRLSVLDRFGGTQARPLSVPVGKIKIIYTAKNISVARLHSLEGSDKLPALEYRSVMLGDIIHVGSAELDQEVESKGSSTESFNQNPIQSLPEEMLSSNPEPMLEQIELKASYFESPVENTKNPTREPSTSPLL